MSEQIATALVEASCEEQLRLQSGCGRRVVDVLQGLASVVEQLPQCQRGCHPIIQTSAGRLPSPPASSPERLPPGSSAVLASRHQAAKSSRFDRVALRPTICTALSR